MPRQTARFLLAAMLTAVALTGCADAAPDVFDVAAYLDEVAADLEAAETDEEREAISQAADERLITEGIQQPSRSSGVGDVYGCLVRNADPYTGQLDWLSFQQCLSQLAYG